MSERTERDLDAALTALAEETAGTTPSARGLRDAVLADAALTTLARDAAATAPLATRNLSDAVLTDAALTTLAREAATAAPEPARDLIARVLADAATVTAEKRAEPVAAPARPRAGAGRARPGLLDRLFGWQAGAIATMTLALGLGLGLGLGLEIDPGTMPLLDEAAPASAITLASLDSDFMGADFPGVGGL